jgi:hypothetical protein
VTAHPYLLAGLTAATLVMLYAVFVSAYIAATGRVPRVPVVDREWMEREDSASAAGLTIVSSLPIALALVVTWPLVIVWAIAYALMRRPKEARS